MNNRVPNGWHFRKLNELGFVGRGKSKHRPRNEPSLYGGQYPFIQTGEVKATELYITDFTQTYNEKGLQQSKLWKPGTLLITIAANIAETAILKIPACFPDSIVGFIADPNEADVRFVKYCIDTIKLRMQNVSKGTTQDNLSVEKLLSFDLLLPPVATQQKIASIVSAYDDLLENNARRIKFLEQTARDLYHEWFVQFRFPGYEQVEEVESEHGRIPENWRVCNLGDVLELRYGKSLTAKNRAGGEVPVYGSSGIVGYHNESVVNTSGIIVGRKGNVGSVFWSHVPFYPIDTVFYVFTNVDLYYIYHNLKRRNFLNTDAAVPGLNRSYALSLPLVLPPNDLVKKYGEIVSPIFESIYNLWTKNQRLREARDLLLPRLISGELDVSGLNIDLPEALTEYGE